MGSELVLNNSKRIQKLVDKAGKGDRSALTELRQETAEEGYFDHLIDHAGDLARHAEHALISAMAGENLLQVEGLENRAKDLKEELAGPKPSPLELILIDRICCCWLAVYHADLNEVQSKGATLAQAEYFQRRHDKAHRRLLVACKALAQVRRLLGPNLQVNVAEKQVNVFTGS